jgi:hypothetical protein
MARQNAHIKGYPARKYDERCLRLCMLRGRMIALQVLLEARADEAMKNDPDLICFRPSVA